MCYRPKSIHGVVKFVERFLSRTRSPINGKEEIMVPGVVLDRILEFVFVCRG